LSNVFTKPENPGNFLFGQRLDDPFPHHLESQAKPTHSSAWGIGKVSIGDLGRVRRMEKELDIPFGQEPLHFLGCVNQVAMSQWNTNFLRAQMM
jgi:hypothetical protein